MTSGVGILRQRSAIGLAAGLFVAGTVACAAYANDAPVAPLTAEQVVQRMVERNELRAKALESYRGTRTYQLDYRGVTTKSATLVVAMTYCRPDEKKFSIVSETGSELLQGRVLKRLLEAEVEAMQLDQRRQTAMNPENYEFRLVGNEEMTCGPEFYILEVTPRVKNKFLFRGRIWVEAQDFAIARMEGEPAKNPSWWTKRNDIHVTYQKVGDFWLPARNETNTQVRIVGHTMLTIVYKDYEILNADAGAAHTTETSGNRIGCAEESAKLSPAQR
jgi:hypothetical protein